MNTQLATKTAAVLCALMMLAACGPSDKQRAEQAEKTRIECLDKFCPGDIEPKRDMTTEVAIKFNGQWYLGPKIYGNPNFGAISFYWPSKAAGGDPVAVGKASEIETNAVGAVANFYDVAIEIFFTGRQRWPEPQVQKPWDHPDGMPPYWIELLSKGLTIKRNLLTPDLERVEFMDANQRKEDRTVFFVAVNAKRLRGQGPPILSCRLSEPMRPDDRCFGGEYWQPDVFADFRFSAKHATDWPAIHQEILRVLSLAKKVQP